MTSVDTKSTVIVSQNTGQNGAIDSYTFKYSNNNFLQNGDYFYVNAPQNVTFLNTSVCAAKSNVKGFTSCKYINSTSMKLLIVFSRRVLSGSIAIN